MSNDREGLREQFDQRPTEELQSILRGRDEGEWRPEVFEVVASVLEARGVSPEGVIARGPEARDVWESEPLVTLATFSSPVEAHASRMALEEAAIPAWVADESLGTMYGIGIGSRLQVRPGDAETAREILSSEPAPADAFPPESPEPAPLASGSRNSASEAAPFDGEEEAPQSPALAGTAGRATSSGAQARLWFEVLAVLCVAVLPDVWNAVYWLRSPALQPPSVLTYSSLGLRALFVTIPVMFVMSLANVPARRFGIVRVSAGDLAVGATIYVVQFVLWRRLSLFFDHGSGFHDAFGLPQGVAQYSLFVAATALSAFAEELVMRGYLITRLEVAAGSWPMALLLSSALFAAYHVYQGWDGTARVFFDGILYGSAFLVTRRLWPLVIAHFLWNLQPLLM
jgi:membrane protease YdiL (CAAX protease family)